MLKITRLPAANAAPTIRIEGRLIGPWVDELEKTCAALPASDMKLELNLADVSYVDSKGAELLLRLRQRGAVFVDCPAYISEELKSADNASATPQH